MSLRIERDVEGDVPFSSFQSSASEEAHGEYLLEKKRGWVTGPSRDAAAALTGAAALLA